MAKGAKAQAKDVVAGLVGEFEKGQTILRPPWFSSPLRGGWFSCEARFTNLLPIWLPKGWPELEALGALATRALDAYRRLNLARSDRDRSLHARQIETLEHEIDDLVLALYDVKHDERKELEHLVAEARAASSGEKEPEPGEYASCAAGEGR